MITVDVAGLALTILLTGLRYPHYVLMAAILCDAARLFCLVLLNDQLDLMVSAGVFSSMLLSHGRTDIPPGLYTACGLLTSYLLSCLGGGIVFESSGCLINPAAPLRNPFAAVNFRFFIVTLLCQLGNNLL